MNDLWHRGLARVYGWACERLYHELAWAYDGVAWVVSAGRWGHWRRMALDAAVGSRVLELGFGTGALLAESNGRRTMVGLEPSAQMQQMAERRLKAAKMRVQRVQGYGQALPFARHCFDTVLATFPAAYILEPSTLRECARVLAAGGRLVIGGAWVSVELGGWERWLPLFYGRPSEEARQMWIERVRLAGFAVQVIERRDGPFRVGIIIGEKDSTAVAGDRLTHET